ncbi:MAG: hypothetical protein A3K67_04590 [Euryarchaeota archaeon RBG_16_62_10]|nr:MAG: hypothetical protein A3K67_04590 [Euryarchaeota archaeon RBG_16_62_10]
MADAPWISSFVAVALLPVAFFFTHAYLSGRRKLAYHKLTGTAGVVWDLSLSIFYMLFRLVGGEVEGSALEITPALTVYFAIHGLVAIIVIALEFAMLGTGLLQWRRGSPIRWHSKLALPLYVLWFVAFLSGELVYVAYYVL